MKKIGALLLAGLLLLSGCASKGQSDAAAGGKTLTLTVESNPTTGYSWEATQDQELFDIQSDYEAEAQSQPVAGAGGVQTFTLTPKKAGTARVSFKYSRPWEPSDADPSFDLVLTVSNDLTVTVTEDGSAKAAEQGYPATVKLN